MSFAFLCVSCCKVSQSASFRTWLEAGKSLEGLPEKKSPAGLRTGRREKGPCYSLYHMKITVNLVALTSEQVKFLSQMGEFRDGRTWVAGCDPEEFQEAVDLLKQAGLDDMVDARVSKADVDESKPDPDVVHAALAKTRSTPAATVMVGDTPYDVEAAARAGLASIALRCGGYWFDRDLRGALHIFDDPKELLERWRQSTAPLHEQV